MKRKISICILVFAVFLLAIAYRTAVPAPKASGGERETESEETEELAKVSSDRVAYSYILRAEDGMVVVCRPDGEGIYMETGIRIDSLPGELAQALQAGIGIKNEEELFDFLENYSS